MSSRPAKSDGIDTLITAQENRALFDRIAPRYDCLNHIMSFGMDRRWRRLAVRRLAPAAGGHYLDLGAGTGDVAFEILRQAPGARVNGVDPSAGMLALARRKAEELGVAERVAFQVGDAVDLAMGDACVDGVISAFCFRNITHRRQALGEMHRVLRPGGRLVLLELTHPEGAVMHALYHAYARVIPLWGRLAGHAGAYRYLIDSINEFLKAGDVVAMLQDAGFKEVRHTPYGGGVVAAFSAVKGQGL